MSKRFTNPFSKKRFLITQPIIHKFNGSTVVTYELARYLQGQGAKVQIFTPSYGSPAREVFEESHLQVITPENQPAFSLDDFDYVWVHSQLIPPELITDLESPEEHHTQFIFLHMSPLDELLPDEFPWIYQLEDKIATARLVISEKTKSIQDTYLDFSPTFFFRNPAPPEFILDKPPSSSLHPKRILVVSNHPPTELQSALEIITNQYSGQFKVHTLGEGLDQFRLIQPSDFRDNDIIITIGKTVQYALVSGTPVFIYDHFGGFGYISDKNYTTAREYNFSGRGGQQYSPEQLVQMLTENYDSALQFSTAHRDEFLQEFSLAKVLPEIFGQLKTRRIQPLAPEYCRSVIASERILINYFATIGREIHLCEENTKLYHRATTSDEQYNQLVHDFDVFRASTSYKLACRIISAVSPLKRFLSHKASND